MKVFKILILKKKKEINLGKDFRIIKTCNKGQKSKLSDAFLSRFTLIFLDRYEEKKVLNLKDLKKFDEF